MWSNQRIYNLKIIVAVGGGTRGLELTTKLNRRLSTIKLIHYSTKKALINRAFFILQTQATRLNI